MLTKKFTIVASVALVAALLLMPSAAGVASAWAEAGVKCTPKEPHNLAGLWEAETAFYASASFGADDILAEATASGQRHVGGGLILGAVDTASWAVTSGGGTARVQDGGTFDTPPANWVAAWAEAEVTGPLPTSNAADADQEMKYCVESDWISDPPLPDLPRCNNPEPGPGANGVALACHAASCATGAVGLKGEDCFGGEIVPNPTDLAPAACEEPAVALIGLIQSLLCGRVL